MLLLACSDQTSQGSITGCIKTTCKFSSSLNNMQKLNATCRISVFKVTDKFCYVIAFESLKLNFGINDFDRAEVKLIKINSMKAKLRRISLYPFLFFFCVFAFL